MHLLECMYPHFVFNLSLISIKKICELTHNYEIHTYFKVNPVIMTMSINSEIQLILTNDRLHVSGCLVNLIWGKVTIYRSTKFKTEVRNDQLKFTGMMDLLNKVYSCVYFFLYEYDILYIYCVIVSISNI